MPYSQNGYSVIQRDDCKFYSIAGIDLPLRPGPCGYVLAHFLRQYDVKVEPLGRTETFGHSYRQIAGSDEWSNHASGTAVDANSSQHPYGKVNTFTTKELESLRELLDEYDGVIRWGGDYRVTKDEMHFELVSDENLVRLLAAVLRRNGVIYLSRLKPGDRNLDVYLVKRALKKEGFYSGSLSKYFGVGLRKAYIKWQESLGYSGSDADGLPGRSSLEALGFTVRDDR